MKKTFTMLGLFFSVLSFGQAPTTLWSYNLPDRMGRSATPAVGADGTIYIGCDLSTRTSVTPPALPASNFFAINPNGTVKWSTSIAEAPTAVAPVTTKPDNILSSASVHPDGSIYTGGQFSQHVFKLNPADGSRTALRKIDTRQRYTAPVFSCDGSTVYVCGYSAGDRGVRSLSADLTTQNWIFKPDAVSANVATNGASPNDFNCTPALATDGTIYAASGNSGGNNKLFAINPNGTQKWASASLVNFVSSAIAIGPDGTIYVSAKLNTVVAPALPDGCLKAFNPIDGSEKWSVTFPSSNAEQGGPAIAADGTIYLGSIGGRMRAFNPANGAELWQYPLAENPAIGQIEVVPAIDNNGKIYFGTTGTTGGGMFYVLNSDGTEAYTPMSLGTSITSAATIGSDGTIYVASTDTTLPIGSGRGRLFALQTTATGLASGNWPMYAINARHTGLVSSTPTTVGSESVSACGSSYTWATSGATYTSSGTYTHVVGCNTATLTLTLTPATTEGSESVSACGSSYTWATSGATYTSSGSYDYVVGCNTATLTLTLTPATTEGSESVSACGSSYTWATSGATYTSSGSYDYVVGCNTAILTLTLTPATTVGSESVSACGSSYTWATSGASYTSSGTYPYVDGCNTATLTLTLTPNTTDGSVTLTQNAGSYTWAANGQTYTSSTTSTVVTGCNTATLNLTIIPSQIPSSPYAVCTGATVGTATAGTTLKFYKDNKIGTAAYAGTQKLSATTYYVTETPEGGPEGPKTAVTVTLTPLVAAPAIASLDSKVICKYIGTNNLVTFTATPAVGTTPSSYSWTKPDGAAFVGDATGSSVQISFLGANATAGLIGSVTVDSKNALGCPSGKPKALALTTKIPSAAKSVVLTYNGTTVKKAGNFVHDASKTLTLTVTDPSLTADHYDFTLPEGVQNVVGATPVGVSTTLYTAPYTGTTTVLTFNLGGVAAANTDLEFTATSDAGCGSASKILKVKRAEAGTPKGIILTDNTLADANAIPPVLPIVLKKLDGYTGTLKERTLTLTATPNATAGLEATSYRWVLPVAATVVGGTATLVEGNTYTSTLPTISINLANVGTEASFVFQVFGVNGNGESLLSKDLTCTSAAPKAPSAIYAGNTGSGTAFAYNQTCGTVTVSVPAAIGVYYDFIPGVGGATIAIHDEGSNIATINLSGTSNSSKTIVITVRAYTATGFVDKAISVKLGAPCTGGRIAPDAPVADEFNVIAYPNPSSSEFTIDVQSSSKGTTHVQVYDMVGRLIENRQVNSNSVQVGSRLASGVYNVIVNQGSKVKTLRVIKR